MTAPLAGKVCVVTGASRGAGKGVARALGEAGATVYVTGRTVAGGPLPKDGAPGSIHATAEEVTRRGGLGIPVQCDHTDDRQTAELFTRVAAEQAGRLDLLVNAAWGGNDLRIDARPFWEQEVQHWDGMFMAGVRTAIVASQHAAALMVPRRSGLIINVSAWDDDRYTQHLFYDAAKACLNRLAFGMAIELQQYQVAALALAPGWMRTERVLAAFVIDPTPGSSATTSGAGGAAAGDATSPARADAARPSADRRAGSPSGADSASAAGAHTGMGWAQAAAAAAAAAPFPGLRSGVAGGGGDGGGERGDGECDAQLGFACWACGPPPPGVPQLAVTESPMYLGRAVAALAAAPASEVLQLAADGRVLRVADLARRYGFVDVDGRQPLPFHF